MACSPFAAAPLVYDKAEGGNETWQVSYNHHQTLQLARSRNEKKCHSGAVSSLGNVDYLLRPFHCFIILYH